MTGFSSVGGTGKPRGRLDSRASSWFLRIAVRAVARASIGTLALLLAGSVSAAPQETPLGRDRPAEGEPSDVARASRKRAAAESETAVDPREHWREGVADAVDGVDRRLGSQWSELRDLTVDISLEGLGDWLEGVEVSYVWLHTGADAIRLEGELDDPGMQPYVQASLKEHLSRWIRWSLRRPLAEDLAGASVELLRDEGLAVLRATASDEKSEGEAGAGGFGTKTIWIGEDLRPLRTSIERTGPDGEPWVETSVFSWERTPPGLRLAGVDCETPTGPVRARFSWVDVDGFELVSRVEVESAVNPLRPLVVAFADWRINQGLEPADLRE